MKQNSKNLIALIILVVAMAGPALADVNQWLNANGNGMWTDPANWSIGVPGPGTGNTRINPDSIIGPMVGPTIGPGEIAVTDVADVWGPEFGALTFTIAGGSYTSPAFVGLVTVGASEEGRPVTNLGPEGSGGWFDVKNLLIGDSWWWHDGPYATFNIYSGTAIVRDYVWLGGKLNLYGGIMYVFNGFSMASVGQPKDLCTLNLEHGILMLPEGYAQRVSDWITAGYCVAYGGQGQVVVEEVPGWVKVTAVLPAPAQQ